MMHWLKRYWFWILVPGLILGCDTNSPEPHKASDLRAVTPQEKLLVNQSNKLSFQYLNLLEKKEPNSNLLFSPVSIGMALGMTNNGIAESSRSQLKKMSGMEGFSEAEINKVFSELALFLQSSDPDISLRFANTFWHRHSVKVDQSLKDILMAYYGAETEAVNFNHGHLPKYISRVIESKTRGLIHSAVNQLDPASESVIYNAAGLQLQPFDHFQSLTTPIHFNGSSQQIPYLYNKGKWTGYYEDDQFVSVEISLGEDKKFSLQAIMALQQSASPDFFRFNEISLAMDTLPINVAIPLFNIDNEVNLLSLLAQSGLQGQSVMPDLFTENSGFFSLNECKHRASFSFGEISDMQPFMKENMEVLLANTMVFDKPFYFFIKENHTGLIIFSGKVNTPEF